jgi:hypothetical protein
LNGAKTLYKFNVQGLRDQLKTVTSEFNTTDTENNIQKTLKELDKKYHLENESFISNTNKIENYSQAVAKAILSLERQIRALEVKSGKTAKSESLRALKDKLSGELQKKKYESGLLEFIDTSVQYLRQVNDILNNVPTTGTNMEQAFKLADATSTATNLRDAYYDVIKEISDSELVNDFAINDTDRDNLRNLAKETKQLFDSQAEKVKELQHEAMLKLGE